MVKFILLVFLAVVCADVVAVYVGVQIGMRYPFMAAVGVNLSIVLLANIVSITWIMLRH